MGTNMTNQTTLIVKKTLLSISIVTSFGLAVWAMQDPDFNAQLVKKAKDAQLMQELEHSMGKQDVEYLAKTAQGYLLSEQEMYEEELRREERVNSEEAQQKNLAHIPVSSNNYLLAVIDKQDIKDKIPPKVNIEQEVLFAFDSSELNPTYYSTLNETAKLMQNIGHKRESLWQIVGYADATGKHAYNIKLAKRRAQAVAQYLVDKGVSEERLSIVSLGDINSENKPLNKLVNLMERRVEIHGFKPEITALAEQLKNQQDNLNKQQVEMQTTKTQSQEIAAIDEHISNEPSEHALPVDLALPAKNTITTAMDL